MEVGSLDCVSLHPDYLAVPPITSRLRHFVNAEADEQGGTWDYTVQFLVQFVIRGARSSPLALRSGVHSGGNCQGESD